MKKLFWKVFEKMFVKNVCNNGIKIAFFLPLGHPPGFVYDFEIRSRP